MAEPVEQHFHCECGATVTSALAADHFCPQPDPHFQDLIRELREAVGLFAGAMSITPKQAWEEAIDRVRLVRQKAGF